MMMRMLTSWTCSEDERVDEYLTAHLTKVDDDRTTSQSEHPKHDDGDELGDGRHCRVDGRVWMSTV